ncbi:hypothetical protein [Streptomyces griseofuscus]|uniref:hypothetical protein n=1 Tax=Streptomyces griseofuscus TaxID=146922 RepID=UPI0034528AFB
MPPTTPRSSACPHSPARRFAAAAALSGLVFVGLSVDIRTVLETEKHEGHSSMTGRALEALAAFLLL